MSSAAPSTALAIPGVKPSVGARVKTAHTPARLKSFLYGIWAAAALLLVVGEGTLRGARDAMKTVGHDSAPSILAAQEISSALADLDASAGNYLLGNKTHQVAAMQAFEKRRARITVRLVDAAKNITYDEERAPVEAMVEGLGRYLEMVGEMRYRKDKGDSAGAETTYGAATDLMHQRLLPAAAQLDKVNHDELQREYAAQETRSAGAEGLAAVVGAVLIGVLVWAQIFLARRMRRLVNPPLLAATLGSVVFLVYLVTRIAVARADLKVAKEDAFESIHALWQARAVAYDANGDETRYLLGQLRAASYEAAYKDKVKKLASEPQPSPQVLGAKTPPTSYTGYFGDALRNITFAGERDAIVAMISAFAEYDRIDQRIRQLDRGGDHAAAVELCIGLGANQSNAAFDRFDAALHKVIEINRAEFDKAITTGQDALATAAILVPAASILIAVLAFLGIRPRLREYAA